jgi:hypothetical protein
VGVRSRLVAGVCAVHECRSTYLSAARCARLRRQDELTRILRMVSRRVRSCKAPQELSRRAPCDRAVRCVVIARRRRCRRAHERLHEELTVCSCSVHGVVAVGCALAEGAEKSSAERRVIMGCMSC